MAWTPWVKDIRFLEFFWYVQKRDLCFLIHWPVVWLAGLHVVLVQVPQSSQLITNKTQDSLNYGNILHRLFCSTFRYSHKDLFSFVSIDCRQTHNLHRAPRLEVHYFVQRYFSRMDAYYYRIQIWDLVLKKSPSSLHYAASPPLVFDHILSHENFAVRPLSKEVFWSLSFPGGSFGFVIYCPVKEESTVILAC